MAACPADPGKHGAGIRGAQKEALLEFSQAYVCGLGQLSQVPAAQRMSRQRGVMG